MPAGRVQIRTSDDVALVADAYPGDAGAPAVLLLHMTPKGDYRRTDWPQSFVAALAARRWSVLVPDRRGAGESGGVADDAFKGPGGRLDVDACHRWLGSYGVDRVVIVGASNGTTSMIDYAARPEPRNPAVVGLGFLSPGPYTENQTRMVDVPRLPGFYAYPEAEREWPDTVGTLARPLEIRRMFPGDAHGTHLFGPHPELADALVDWIADVLDG
jgi:pimeloyl-ACP methyl ester carboxylesterase